MSGIAYDDLWLGAANAWECDHLGHMNTRFYLAKIEQALPPLLDRIGVDGATMMVTAQHMRFHKEVRVGAPLRAYGAVLGSASQGSELLVMLGHAGGDLAATFRLSIARPMDAAAPRAAGVDSVPVPAEAQERGVSMADLASIAASADEASSRGMRRTGLSTIQADHCDHHGRLRLSAVMALAADAVPHLPHGIWREMLERNDGGAPRRIGTVLLESGFIHRRWPSLGERVEVRSAPAGCTDRVTRTEHRLLDPATGRIWAVVHTVGLPLDLDTRRAVRLTPEVQDAYRMVAGTPLA